MTIKGVDYLAKMIKKGDISLVVRLKQLNQQFLCLLPSLGFKNISIYLNEIMESSNASNYLIPINGASKRNSLRL